MKIVKILALYFLSFLTFQQELLPQYHISVHQSAIRSIAWIRAPPAAASGNLLLSEDPTVIASGGCDGVEGFTDLREPATNVFNRTRGVRT